MIDFNCVGRVAEKPEMKKTSSGIDYCSLILSSDKPFANQDGKTEKEDFNITCWKTVAEEAIKNVNPGMLLYVKGRIVSNNYRGEDKFYFKTDLVAERISAIE